MQRVSAAYRSEQNQQLREEGYIWVYLGVISKEAQANAIANGDFTIYSDEQKSNDSVEFEAYYATPEQNFTRVDSSQFFLPRRDGYALYQGAVTQEICAPITYTFGSYTKLDIKGLTIDFGDFYPTSFTISNGQARYTYDYTNDKAGEWVCEDIFRETDHITITPHTMVGGIQRLRILNILFGVGLVFTNEQLISTTWVSTVEHIMDSLPTKSFQFTISNLNKRFAADDPHSFVSFLQEQQELDFQYGRRLANGAMYLIPGGKMYLKSWSSDDTQAKFSAVGLLDYISGTYNKGQYYPNGISLYDLAEEVCQDAGIEKYCIDNYLQTLITHNPLPVEKHRNLLQLIAHSSRSVMRETRDGGIEILSSFEPNITSITTNGQTVYSNVETVVNEDITPSEYGTAEKDFTHTDQTQFFLPRNSSAGYVETGYISSGVSRADGTFVTNPTITIQWESSWTFFNLTVLFKDAKPTAFTVHLYNYGTLVESVEETDIEFSTNVKHDFYDVDKIVIEFTNASPYQRIHVAKIRFGNITDYTLDYSDMAASPKAITTDFVKNVNVVYSEFAYGVTSKKLSTTKALSGKNTITFNKPCHDYALSFKDGGSGTLQILESGAYYLKFTSSREAEVNVNGIEFVINEKTYTQELNQVGTDKTAKSVLIDNLEMAQAECEWLCDYFDNDVEYEIQYRGEPALDPDDQIYTENKYVELNLVRIVSSQIETSTGMSMSCKLKGRRTRWIEPALVDVAIVDESLIIS